MVHLNCFHFCCFLQIIIEWEMGFFPPPFKIDETKTLQLIFLILSGKSVMFKNLNRPEWGMQLLFDTVCFTVCCCLYFFL